MGGGMGGSPFGGGMGGMGGMGGGMGGSNHMQAMMQNPMMQQMMQQMLSDPNAINQMAAMNPQLGQALQDPQVGRYGTVIDLSSHERNNCTDTRLSSYLLETHLPFLSFNLSFT